MTMRDLLKSSHFSVRIFSVIECVGDCVHYGTMHMYMYIHVHCT